MRGTSAARVLTENALFMNSWRCFSTSSAAFSAMNMSPTASCWIGPSVAGIKSSSLSYLSAPSSASTESELPFPSALFGVIFALFVAGGSVATAEERRLPLMEETEYVPIGVSHPTEAKGNRRDGVGAVFARLLDSVVPPDSKP